jgi:hypothetical protein
MTQPLNVDPDDLRGYSSRTRARAADFKTSPPDVDGDWPSHRATRRMHAGVHAAGQGFGDDLDASAHHADKSADSYQHQEAGNTSAMKDVMGIMTSAVKDGEGAAADYGKTMAQIATTTGTAATQAATTGMTAAIAAAATGAKAAPASASGAPIGLAGSTGSVTDSPTTDHDGKGHERKHADADADS